MAVCLTLLRVSRKWWPSAASNKALEHFEYGLLLLTSLLLLQMFGLRILLAALDQILEGALLPQTLDTFK